MTRTLQMIEAQPNRFEQVDKKLLADCIDACTNCAQVCTACADACLAEDMVAELRDCISTDLNCADICETTGRVLSRFTGYDATTVRTVLEACAQSCKACADDCAEHAEMHEHCKICAEACRACESACRELLTSMG